MVTSELGTKLNETWLWLKSKESNQNQTDSSTVLLPHTQFSFSKNRYPAVKIIPVTLYAVTNTPL